MSIQRLVSIGKEKSRELRKYLTLRLKIIRLRMRRFCKRCHQDSSLRWVFYGGVGFCFICLLSVVVQVGFPGDRLTSKAHMMGRSVSWWTRNDIEKLAKDSTPQTQLQFVTRNGKQASSVDNFGGTVCSRCVADKALDYPWWQRLMPFSLWWRSVEVNNAEVKFDESALETKMAEYGDSLTLPPENARVEIQNDKVVVVAEKAGRELQSVEARQAIASTQYSLGDKTEVQMKGKRLSAKVTEKQLQELRSRVEKILQRNIAVEFEGKAVKVDKSTIAKLLSFIEDGHNIPKIALNQAKLTEFLEHSFGKVVNKPAGKTVIYMHDGTETKRENGAPGRGIDVAQMTTKVQEVLLGTEEKDSRLALVAKQLPPQPVYKETFSHSALGLQAYVNSVARDHDIRLTVSQVSGENWSAQVRGSESSVSASTYKLYIAMVLMDKIDNNQLTMNDKIGGVSVQECITRMIVNSDNACPEATIAQYTASGITEYLREGKGFKETSLRGSYVMTSTNDLAKILKGIDDGTLVRGSHRDFLLGLMQRQVYRQGIPAGSGGTVQDKVGFLEGYLNDAAIVTHPKGKYVMSIITKGQSWGKIAEITRKLEDIMYGG